MTYALAVEDLRQQGIPRPSEALDGVLAEADDRGVDEPYAPMPVPEVDPVVAQNQAFLRTLKISPATGARRRA